MSLLTDYTKKKLTILHQGYDSIFVNSGSSLRVIFLFKTDNLQITICVHSEEKNDYS